MLAKRMARELALLTRSPPPGIAAWPREEGRVDILDAEITGASDTPYSGGVFRLEVGVPPEYPLQPPRVRFITPIYHPNIDDSGRVCLDTLSMPPKGAWKPSLNVATVLASVQLLMAEPNPDDGLMVDITEEYKTNRKLFECKARNWTATHAKGYASATQSVQDQKSGAAGGVNDSMSVTSLTAARSAVGSKYTEDEANPSSRHQTGQDKSTSTEVQTQAGTRPSPNMQSRAVRHTSGFVALSTTSGSTRNKRSGPSEAPKLKTTRLKRRRLSGRR